MGDDRVTSVYDARIVTALIEHTHIKTEHVCKIDSAVSSAFVRTDRHHMLAVDLQVFDGAQQTFDELIGRRDCLKTT